MNEESLKDESLLDDTMGEMKFDDDYDEDSKIPYEIPKEVRKITTQAYDKSVSDIVRMIEDKDIRLDPDYQRNYVWDNKKASMLIESIILNVPIPVIYVSQEEDDSWSVIDGLQRLSSLKRFFDGKFKLSGLEILSDLNKSDITNLNPKALRMLKNGLLRVIMITHDSNEEIKYDVFMRLNTGSVHLTEQELRNCLYRGALNKFLKEVVQNQKWLALMGLKEPHKRMADREMVLRFLAIWKNWDSEKGVLNGYKGRMKSFLNAFMNEHKEIKAHESNEWKRLFEETVEKVYQVYGEYAFKRQGLDGMREKTINRAIIDVIMLSATQHSMDELMANKDRMVQRFLEMTNNDVYFRNSIKIGTSDTKVITFRLSIWCREVDRMIAGD
ncbi:MAG: DUF262 domain-containing protein [Prevotella sp.]|nr:DUF262 domain-containing protein [Prevotella sp.]